MRSGAFRTPITFPFVIGRDLAGTVAVAGPGAPGFAVGDRVWCNSLGHAGRQGAAAQYAVVATERLYHVPNGVDPLCAVAVAHPPRADQTRAPAAWRDGVHRRRRPCRQRRGTPRCSHRRPGDRERELRRLDRCRSLGAHAALDYRDPELGRRIRDAALDGVDGHLDTSGRQDLEAAVDLLASRGRIVLMAAHGEDSRLPVRRLYTRDSSIVGFAISNASVTDLARAAGRITSCSPKAR